MPDFSTLDAGTLAAVMFLWREIAGLRREIADARTDTEHRLTALEARKNG
jgi:hypothetical protein